MRRTIFKLPSPSGASQKTQVHQSFSESLLEENIEAVESIIGKWTSSDDQEDSVSSSSSYCSLSSLFSANNREEARLYVQAVQSLQKTMRRLITLDPGSKRLVRAQSLMKSAMKHLENEFYRILKSKRQYLDPESVSVRSSTVSSSSNGTSRSVSDSDSDDQSEDSDYTESRAPSGCDRGASTDADAMADLKMIADCMISAGYAKECVTMYKRVRRSVVDDRLNSLGVERLNFSQIQKMEWKILETKIKTWLRAAKTAVRTLFSGERILCDYVFSSWKSIIESCFADIARDGALTLFSFPESVGKCRNSPEKIFRVLDLHETLSNLMPEIELIFSFPSTATIRSQVVDSLSKLGEAVISMMSDFESSMEKHRSKSALPGGGVHPLARYVMNYLAFLADYADSLSEILADSPLTISAPLPESYFSGESLNDGVYSSPISVRIAWLVLLLLCKIDGKARLYDDVAKSYLFLANNLQYVVVKVQTSNLRPFLGDDWIAKHDARVKHYTVKYEKLAWGKVLTSLPSNPTAEITLEDAKERFKRFNAAFEEAYQRQTSWVVPDRKLRDEIKLTLARKLIPAYGEFYGKYRVALSNHGSESSTVRFGAEDLGNYLSDLFSGDGCPGLVSGSSNRSVSPPSSRDRRGRRRRR